MLLVSLGVPGLVVQGARRVVFVLRLEVGHYAKCMRVSNFFMVLSWGWWLVMCTWGGDMYVCMYVCLA